MKGLTRAEETIMKVLWAIGEGTVKDVLEQMPDAKPAYNTVSTVVRVLETKGFVDHKKSGKWHVYFPLVPKGEYNNHSIRRMLDSYFQGSLANMVSFFADSNDVNLDELESIIERIKKKKQ